MNKTSTFTTRAACAFFLIACAHVAEAASTSVPDIAAILKEADQSRGNLQGITWEVVIESLEAQRTVDTMTWKIQARGFDISGLSLDPPKYKGNKLLMTNNNMWFYKPGLSKPVPIAQRQKLTGNAAYGDIAATNYAEDYEPTLLPDETINGEACYVFDLKSRNDTTTYDRIKYWVSKKDGIGVHAEYFTVSGKKFKFADMEYSHRVKMKGKTRPFISKITLHDSLISENITYLNLLHPRFEALPDYVFNINLFMK